VLNILNNDLDENIHLKNTRSMIVANFFRVDLNCLGLVDTVLMHEGRLLKTLLSK